MDDLKVRLAPPPLLRADCACTNLEESLIRRGVPAEEVARLISDWPAARDLLDRSSNSNLARGPYLVPTTANDLEIPDDPIAKLDKTTIKQILDVLAELERTPYQVIVLNGTDDDINDLQITFYLNRLIGSTIQPTGPFTKGPLPVLPPGKTVGFQTTTNCLEMADKYFIQGIMPDGTKFTFAENIVDLNNKERQQPAGIVDFCGDSLEIFAETPETP